MPEDRTCAGVLPVSCAAMYAVHHSDMGLSGSSRQRASSA